MNYKNAHEEVVCLQKVSVFIIEQRLERVLKVLSIALSQQELEYFAEYNKANYSINLSVKYLELKISVHLQLLLNVHHILQQRVLILLRGLAEFLDVLQFCLFVYIYQVFLCVNV